MSVVGHQLDVFLFEPESDRYLGRLCSFNTCPKGKIDCLVPGCGAIAFNKRIADFSPRADLLAAADQSMLYRRGAGRLRSALDLPTVEQDKKPGNLPSRSAAIRSRRHLGSRMPDLSAFPITARWPARHPERLQLYSLPTPNGVKVSIMLEEIGLPYEAHLIDIGQNDNATAEFLSLNPNGKIPAIIDPDGPGGAPLRLFESGGILVYLAEKTGKLLPAEAARRYEALAWVCFQMGAVGPMFGQVGYFHKFAGRQIADRRPLEHYRDEARRLLAVLEARLDGRRWIMDDDYTIADISLLGWVRNLIGFYEARELVAFDALTHVPAWLERGLARPAVQRGLEIPKRS